MRRSTLFMTPRNAVAMALPLLAAFGAGALAQQPATSSSAPQVHQAEVAAGAAPSSARLQAGAEVYKVACIACHQESGWACPAPSRRWPSRITCSAIPAAPLAWWCADCRVKWSSTARNSIRSCRR